MSKVPTILQMEEKIVGLDEKSGDGGVVERGAVEEEDEEVELPGFRFHPTDEELVGFYLKRKVEKKPLSIEIIRQIDIYKYDPWDLPKVSTVGEKEWYFFCLRGRKYRNSIRPNRVTGSGFWKATGIDRSIYSAGGSAGDCIGLKKSLVYYRGSAGKGTKTDWMMHEFRLPSGGKNDVGKGSNSPSIQEAETWTICRIFKRNVSLKRYTHSWKESTSKQTPADSGSKTSSFESDAGDDYKCFGGSNVEQSKRVLTNFFDQDKNQLQLGWNPTVQAPLTALHPDVQNPKQNEFLKEENWDELGRMMELYMIDPTTGHQCRYC